MFSRNTSKSLTFTVTTDEPVDEGMEPNDCDMSGWLLKKRRKRMQGWAKRWFELSSTGVLSYSVRKGDIKRGSIQILLATISLSPKQRTIHLDSGTTIFHLKALSNDLFDAWLNCIRTKRSITNNVIWNEDGGIQSAISLLPDSDSNDYEINHQLILKALNDMDNELKYLKSIVSKELSVSHDTLVASPTSADISSILPPPPPLPHSHSSNSSSSLKLRFPFKRGTSSTNSDEHHHKSSMITVERLSQSIKLLSDYREKMSTSYLQNYNQRGINPLEIPGRTGTGFSTHRSASFYSYSAQSDLFFDAEDDFELSNEEVESTHGSIVVDSEDEDKVEVSSDDLIISKDNISRRTRLSHPVAVRTISVLGILRKNIGKDLSTISMPISLNEPINLLQRLCEELEYCDLLDKATAQTSSMDRLMYVTAFAISGYASSQYRIGRKPFNPLMCETYECIRPDKGFRFISEKVSHYPNVMACHAESRNFQYRQSYFGKTKFWGKSMELITEGQSHISLTGHEDQYTYSKPSSWLRNLVTGTKYLEHIGEMKVDNHATGEYAIVTFKEAAASGGSFFSSGSNVMHRNNVVAKFYDCRGSLIREVQGKWSDTLSEVVGPDQYSVIWRSKPPSIPDYQDYYGLTQFAMEINEITSLEKDKLPITDTRYRPDQRLFENGKVSEAEDEKIRVEQLQREKRKQYEAQNKAWVPFWFELKPDAYSPTGDSWQYKGGYWEARKSGQWPREILQLW
ncbi:Oxysterol-binding protein-domain-containing protein [Mucor mucedo]|uniref:Oxysterol-binding protein-domain-containing protein n=1 Tax=Mucor mucedo TaxID=29922 RepID=UPI00221F7025|nr:Oxysterol-binding protein-domain-containing protein [Mucor mucedo]KAI7887614.1 Oxysterol-binding protein-domain-containing protein [Mucor mucedo]